MKAPAPPEKEVVRPTLLLLAATGLMGALSEVVGPDYVVRIVVVGM